jgi:small nuclear ribonucleoprotein (snRNP)-like protein
MSDLGSLADYIGKEVVLDTRAPIVYLGRLERADEHFFVLADVDVHDMADGHSTKERYILESKKHGVRKNRNAVLVRRDEVVSLSKLEDVVEF